MNSKAERKGGLFEWLKPLPPVSNDVVTGEASAASTVVPLFSEAPAPAVAPTASGQEMFALLDALRAAEQAKPASEIYDDFGDEGAAAGTLEAEPATFSLDRSIHSLPSEGWLISELQYDTTPFAAPQSAATEDHAAKAEATRQDAVVILTRSLGEAATMPQAMLTEVKKAETTDEAAQPAVQAVAPMVEATATAQSILAETPVMEAQETATAESAATESEPADVQASENTAAESPASILMITPMANDIEHEAAAGEETNPASHLLATLPPTREIFASLAQGTMQGLASAEKVAGQLGSQLRHGFEALKRAMPKTAGPQVTLDDIAPISDAMPSATLPLAPMSLESFNTPGGMPLAMPAAPLAVADFMNFTPQRMDALLEIPEAAQAKVTARPVRSYATVANNLPAWLEERMASHRLWLESDGTDGKRFRYGNEDLAGLNLAGLDFTQAQLRGAPLAGMDLRGTRLEGADLSEADLSRALLTDANANGANFARADLHFADLQQFTAQNANFSFADLHGARLTGANLRGSTLREVNLQAAVAIDANFADCNMRAARLFEAIMPGVDLRNADLRNALIERTVFTGAQLNNAYMKDAAIIDLDYAQTDFTVALEVPQEVQLAALSAERAKLNDARSALDARNHAIQARELKLQANLRVLEQKRHQDGQLERQENEVFDALAGHASWLKRGSFWWGGVVACIFALGWMAISVTPVAAINIPVLGTLAAFGVLTTTLAGLSFLRVQLVRSRLAQLLRHRQAMKAALSAQAALELARAQAQAAKPDQYFSQTSGIEIA